MEYNIDNAELTATLTAVNLDAAVIGQAPLEVAIGESARIDVGEAINYVKSGAAEINRYVNNVSKPEIDRYVEDTAEPLVAQIIEEQAEPVINAYVDNEVIPNINSVADSTLTAFNNNASAKTTAFNDNASAKTTAFDNNASAKTTAFDNNAASAIATIEPLVTTATSAATAASTSATNAATSASNASSSASDALSAKNAAVAAKDAAESAATDVNVVAVGTDLRDSPSKIKTVANNITDVNTVANSISNVNSVAGNISNVNAVAGNATNINAVNTNKNNINTVAGISSDVSTVAGIASDITTVVGSTAIISTVANNIANVNNVGNDILKVNAVADDLRNINAVYNSLIDIGAVASRIVDITDVAAISSDVSTVAGIALDITDVVAISSDISTVASNAANVRTVANNDTNISTVATNISDVNTVATNTSNIATVVANITDIQNASSNAQKARDWAVKMDGKIDGDDYSAKYYAAKAEEAAASVGDPANKDLSNLSATGEAKFTAKQDVISDLATIRSGASAGATAVQPADLATVATSGSYNDLSNKPTIPAAQVNSDWNAISGVAQILNKPDLSNYVTLNTDQDISGYKTFLSRPMIFNQWPEVMLVDSVAKKGTAPASNRNGMFEYVDQNHKFLAAVIPYYAQSKETRLELRCYSAQAASDTSYESVMLYGGTGGSDSGALSVPSTWPKGTDNTKDLGKSWARWKQLYAGTTSINTSDERVKQGIESVPDDVLDAWGEVEFYRYKFNDAVEEKGFDNARYHTGMVAQRIERVFAEHGLNAFDYGLLCYDEWEAVEEEKDKNGEIIRPARAAGNRYSLRYEECLCMEAAYQRRRADRIEARLAALEARL